MSKATYWQRGETLDYKNNTDQVIEANAVLTFGSRIGVAGTTINPGKMGSVHVTGVYDFPKTDSAAIGQGTSVYWDGNGITGTADGNICVGYAAQSAEADDAFVRVKLLG